MLVNYCSPTYLQILDSIFKKKSSIDVINNSNVGDAKFHNLGYPDFEQLIKKGVAVGCRAAKLGRPYLKV